MQPGGELPSKVVLPPHEVKKKCPFPQKCYRKSGNIRKRKASDLSVLGANS